MPLYKRLLYLNINTFFRKTFFKDNSHLSSLTLLAGESDEDVKYVCPDTVLSPVLPVSHFLYLVEKGVIYQEISCIMRIYA